MSKATNLRGDKAMTFRDAQQAYSDAISNGVLSENPNDTNYAGNYMYMHSEGIQDGFKHIDTRKYLWTEYEYEITS